MQAFGRWMRGALGMGAIWGAAGAVGVLVAGVSSIVSGHAHKSTIPYLLSGMIIWVPIAFATGVLFATLVTLASRSGYRNAIAPWKGAVAGGAIGMSIIALLPHRGAETTVIVALASLIGIIGATVGSTILWIARRGSSPTDPRFTSNAKHALRESASIALHTPGTPAHELGSARTEDIRGG